jgi:CRP-like cAMP-binding protein
MSYKDEMLSTIGKIMTASGLPLRFQPKETFIHQGQAVDQLYFLANGKVKVETIEANGRSLLLCFMEAPAFLGDVELFRQDVAATCTVSALTPVTVWCMDHAQIRRLMLRQPGVMEVLARSLADKMVAFTRASARNLLYPLQARYAAYLWEMGEGAPEVPIRLEETAGLLGTSPRHVQRVISDLVSAGLVERHGRRLRILDQAGLRSRAES